MNLHTFLLTRNGCYKSGKAIKPRGVMIHSTGANNPRLSRYVAPNDGLLGAPSSRHWNQSGTTACVHAFIGKLANGTIATYQTLPWTMRGWHCGRSGNDTHISIEICEDGLTDASYFEAVYREAVELTAYLCRKYALEPLRDGVVLCHAEGYKLGIASNHGDVLHWFPKFGKSMDDFRADVAKEMEEPELTETQVRAIVREEIAAMEAERAALPPSDWARANLEIARAKRITDGTRPQSYATRQEVALMVNAAVKK